MGGGGWGDVTDIMEDYITDIMGDYITDTMGDDKSDGGGGRGVVM